MGDIYGFVVFGGPPNAWLPLGLPSKPTKTGPAQLNFQKDTKRTLKGHHHAPFGNSFVGTPGKRSAQLSPFPPPNCPARRPARRPGRSAQVGGSRRTPPRSAEPSGLCLGQFGRQRRGPCFRLVKTPVFLFTRMCSSDRFKIEMFISANGSMGLDPGRSFGNPKRRAHPEGPPRSSRFERFGFRVPFYIFWTSILIRQPSQPKTKG